MADFVAPLDPIAGWTLAGDTELLPGTVRYAGRRIATLRATAGSASLRIVAPAKALLRVHAGSGGGVVLELEPVPFAIATAIGNLKGGLPTFYVALASATVGEFAGVANTLVEAAGTLRTLAAGDIVRIAVLAQDRLILPPATWTSRIRAAMMMDPSPSWNDFDDAVAAATGGATAPVFVLDGAGRPLVDATIDVQVGTQSFSVTLAETDGGDLQRAILAAGRPGLWTTATSATLSIAPASAAHRWVQFGSGTKSDGSITVSPADPHVLFTDLERWFAPQHVQGVLNIRDLPRFTNGNKVGFFIDGGAFFRDLVTVARRLPGLSNSWMAFSGWGFEHDFKLGPRRGATDDDPTFLELMRELADPASGTPVEVRVLANRFIQIDDNEALWLAWAVLAIVSCLYLVLGEKYHIEVFESDSVGIALLLVALTYLVTKIYGTDLRSLEKNADTYDAVNAAELQPHVRAVWSRNPATIDDNPHAQSIPIDLQNAGATHFGVYHMKAMAARREGELFAWIGGMDIASNRRDDPRRVAQGPFHDVQARVEGPAAEDIAYTLRDRWHFDAGRETDAQPAEPIGGPAALPELVIPPILPRTEANGGTEIAQVARTYPRVGDTERELTFAPNGDFTIHDTLIQALAEAREFIYIEDQYFNPGTEYREALLAAIPNVERLICIMPSGPDQPLGDLHRREFIQQLKAAGPGKVIIRAPIRRPTMPPSRRRASYGRLILRSALSGVPGPGDEVVLWPDSRIPHAPFWLVIDGESMLVMEQMPTVPGDEPGTQRFRVRRGSDAAPGIHTRAHEPGTPAAIAHRNGIYVHAKTMVIDDLFLSIGSANLNRRGLKHDGEGNIFTVPEKLRQTPANLARRLRIAQWAAHLDLPLEIATPLLHDPIRSSALFLREYERGNRAVEIDEVGANNVIPSVLTPGTSFAMQALAALGVAVTTTSDQAIWDTIADPTTEDL